MTIGEQILEAMFNALNNASTPPAKTWRTRVDAFNAKELPAIVLYSLTEAVEVKGPQSRLRKRKVRLEVMVQGEPPADQVVDPIYAFAVTTILNDAPTAALVKGLYESSIQWETEASYEDACIAAVDLDVHFLTTENPSQAGKQ